MSRDPSYEERFLFEVEREAQRRFGVEVQGFRTRVERRLAIGSSRYGDDDYLEKDVLLELLDETPDVAAYCLLEAQKTLADVREPDGHAHHLFEAAVLAAVADWHAIQARRGD